MEHSPFEFLLNLSLTPVNKQQELPRWQNFPCMLAKIIATVSSPPPPRLDAVLKSKSNSPTAQLIISVGIILSVLLWLMAWSLSTIRSAILWRHGGFRVSVLVSRSHSPGLSPG